MPDPLTLFHVSDVHFGVEDHAAHSWFADAVAKERPDAVVCTGDLTQRATHAQFAAATAWLAGMKAGVYPDAEGFAKGWALERRFEPAMTETDRQTRYAGWQRAVQATLSV